MHIDKHHDVMECSGRNGIKHRLPAGSSAVSFFLALFLWFSANPAVAMVETDSASQSSSGEAIGTAFLGEDVLWRPRESLIFHIWNEDGDGFEVDFTLRDMETYMQGQRPVKLWVVAPDGQVAAEKLIEPSRNPAGQERHRDGIYDMGQDFRYRAWHRAFSDNGYPEDRERNPYLEHPEKLDASKYSLRVPAAGKGAYRLVVLASWDNWISVDLDRPMPMAVHAGNGPLYVHPGRLAGGAYLYVPEFTRELGLAMTEEIEPFNWSLDLFDPQGERAAEIRADRFYNYAVYEPEYRGDVYRLEVEGETTGACLHIEGVPALLAPDRETAELFKRTIEIDDQERLTSHPFQRTLNRWRDGLTEAELAVDTDIDTSAINDQEIRGLVEETIEILAKQSPDPADEAYRGLTGGRGDIATMARAASTDHAENPFYADAALIRRIALGQIETHRGFQPHFSWRDNAQDLPTTFDLPVTNPFGGPLRSNYIDFEPGRKRHLENVLLPLKPYLDEALPGEIVEALKKPYELWTYARSVEHMGESSNKWAMNIDFMQGIGKLLDHPERIERLVDRQLDRLLTPAAVGRANPDPTPYRSQAGYTFAGPADIGMTGAGYVSEQWGFDAGYADNTERYMRNLFFARPEDGRIIEYFEQLYFINTHLSLPIDGRHPTDNLRRQIVSPSDSFSRLEQHTNRSGLPSELKDRITYGDLWHREPEPRRPWPALAEEPFTKVLDNQYYFINTGEYYSIHYGGEASPHWRTFNTSQAFGDGSADFVGYGDGMRGIPQRKSANPGGLSAVFVPGTGPTILALNQSPVYANTLWGMLPEPITEYCDGNMDPEMIACGFNDAVTSFCSESRVYRKRGEFIHAPISYSRTLRFQDDRIIVSLDFMAMRDLDLQELNEAIPFFAHGDRAFRFYDRDFRPINEWDAADSRPDAADLRAFWFGNPESGAGSTVIFEDTVESAWVKESADRSGRLHVNVRSLQLPMPNRLRAGQHHRLRYVIHSHSGPVAAEDLQQIAEELD